MAEPMIEPAYYYLNEVEVMFRMSRDTLTRWARAGLFELCGQNRGRRVTGESVRRTYARSQAGEDLWALVRQVEQSQNEQKPTGRVRSIGTRRGGGGINPQPATDSDSLVFAPLTSKTPDWLSEII